MVELELGEDILQQVSVTHGNTPDNTSLEEVKFDAKGNLHIMHRDVDGKLLRDDAILHEPESAVKFSDAVDIAPLNEQVNILSKKKEDSKSRFNTLLGLVGWLFILALIVMFSLMR